MDIKNRIEAFNRDNAPFYLVDHDSGEFSLCLALSFVPQEYRDFGQEAFNRYAERNGEPVMENGLYTHGSGYEWEDVLKKPLKRMKISARSVLTARRAASSAMRRIYPCWRSLDVGFGRSAWIQRTLNRWSAAPYRKQLFDELRRKN